MIIADETADLAVAAADILAQSEGLNIDGFLEMLIAIIIIISGIFLIKETGNIILGKAPDLCFVLAIKEKILSYDGIYGIHDMVMHDYGPGRRL